jgi:hypothetical protein
MVEISPFRQSRQHTNLRQRCRLLRSFFTSPVILGMYAEVDGRGKMEIESSCDRPEVLSDELRQVLQNRRLEVVSCLANTSMNFLKRLSDRTPVFERYCREETALHVHYKLPYPLCIRWRRKTFGLLEHLLGFDQPAMPIPVGKCAEVFDPMLYG